MKAFTGQLKDGRNYEVKVVEFIDKIEANGGAAPWMIGKAVKNYKQSLFIEGESVAQVGVNNHLMVQELVNAFGI